MSRGHPTISNAVLSWFGLIVRSSNLLLRSLARLSPLAMDSLLIHQHTGVFYDLEIVCINNSVKSTYILK